MSAVNQVTLEHHIDQNFPFFNKEERKIIAGFSLTVGKDDTRFNQYKSKILGMLQQIHIKKSRLQLGSRESRRYLAKLINMAGLFQFITIEELCQLGVKESASPLTYSSTDLGLPESIVFEDFVELFVQNILQLNSFNILLSLPKMEDETFLDDLVSTVERIVFVKDITTLLSSQDYIGATSEPLSKTVIIQNHTRDGEKRDLISMSFEIILQSAMIDLFHHYSEDYNTSNAERIARIQGHIFLTLLLKLSDTTKQLEQSNLFLGFDDELVLKYVNESTTIDVIQDLYNDNVTQLSYINEKIGFPSFDLELHLS